MLLFNLEQGWFRPDFGFKGEEDFLGEDLEYESELHSARFESEHSERAVFSDEQRGLHILRHCLPAEWQVR